MQNRKYLILTIIICYFTMPLYSMEDQTTTTAAVLPYKLAYSINAHQAPIHALCLSNDQKSIFTGDKNGLTKEWNAKTHELECIYDDHIGAVTALLPLRASLLCSASTDATINIWDILTHQCRQTIRNTHPISGLAEVPQQYYLYSSDTNNCVKKWDLKNATCIISIPINSSVCINKPYVPGRIRIVTDWFSERLFITDKEHLYVVNTRDNTSDKTLYTYNNQLGNTPLYNAESLESSVLYYISSLFITKVRCSDFSQISSLSLSKKRFHINTLTSDELSHAVFAGLKTNTIEVFDTQSRSHTQTLEGHTDTVSNLVYNDDTLYSTSFDGTLKIWKKE